MERTSYEHSDGVILDGTACDKCGKSYKSCSQRIFERGVDACCPTCRRTGTHVERLVVRRLVPGEDLQVGDQATLRYTTEDKTTEVTGEVVGLEGEAIYLPSFPGWPFSKQGLHSALRKVTPLKPPTVEGVLQAKVEELQARIDVLQARIDVLVRPVARGALAKRLFLTRMARGRSVSPETAERLWNERSGDYIDQWLAVADEAIKQLHATDM